MPVMPGNQRIELSTAAVTATSRAGEYHMEKIAAKSHHGQARDKHRYIYYREREKDRRRDGYELVQRRGGSALSLRVPIALSAMRPLG
jgi:hypothetical protein